MQLSIKTRGGKTKVLEVAGADTLDNVKAKIQEMEGFSLEDYVLHFEPKPLEWQPKAGSKSVYLRIPNSKRDPLDLGVFQPSDTVSHLMSQIMRMECFYADMYKLYFAGTLLESNRTLASYNIHGGSVLDLVWVPGRRGPGYMEICVHSDSIDGMEWISPFRIHEDLTIKELKAMCEEDTRVPNEHHKLSYAGAMFDDDSLTLAACNVKDMATLYFVDVDRKMSMKILVENVVTQKIIVLDVKSTDTVYDVKAKIWAKEKDIPSNQQVLYISQNPLQDSSTLADYSIQNGSTLYIVQIPPPNA